MARPRLTWLLCIGAAIFLVFGSTVHAQNIIEQLVNPGPLAKGHAKLEATCSACHTPFSRETQNALCLSCHKPVATDLSAHTGFHGLSPEVAASQCRRCHSDHKGRDADIVLFDPRLFDHALTQFPLAGGHVGLACVSCHAANTKFRDASIACSACHGKEDPHKGDLGSDCGRCHVAENWRKTTAFDHDKTKMPLMGAHAKVECRSCHAGKQFTQLPLTCVGCHTADDVHNGGFGDKCQSCHSTDLWKTVTFNHDKTQFPLRGAHRAVTCDGCHSADPSKDKLPLTCIGCHQKDDFHKGTFGTNCASCHNETSWKQATNFNHDRTSFPLVGRHKTVACADCHKSKDFKAAPLQCQQCHQDTFHEGRLGDNCVSCHTPSGWLQWHFDHDTLTRFPLTGAHRGLDCHACHDKPVAGKPVLETICGACHRKDDVHHGTFGQNCERCHTTATFQR